MPASQFQNRQNNIKPDPEKLAYIQDDIPEWRQHLSENTINGFTGFLRFMSQRWLTVLNTFNIGMVGLALAVPLAEQQGWRWLSVPVNGLCNLLCVQEPSHSFFIEGHQMGLCQRCLAIYALLGLTGLLFHIIRNRLQPLKLWQYGIFSLPMLIDAFTQLFGWRQSAWELRLLTGGLFAIGTVWYIYPQIEIGMRRMKARFNARLLETRA
ncbi:MAG: DUF2085 domain-containing protein [Chloroflexi bacterium]|uniref:DUF2085 domain-containing protein n=1 Tax=Candidatus Chlorohelix allophototropha TaxID=3003348 RepID=A0A8T7LXK6_9CHLR|nr:DUF2085 domain-containing protein [Chloroflexota bacterium]WJW67480.1 DUF2085 domain-containing protein [Chloroflexota bacterium L227-S17]